MRILFLLLILLNVAFFAWFSRAGDDRSRPADEAQDPGVAQLVLLRERPSGGAGRADRREDGDKDRADGPPAAVAETPGPEPFCYEAGPFSSEAAARDLLRALASVPVAWEVAGRETRVQIGYWVRWPETLSLREARRVYRELRDKGVEDIAITPAGEGRYTVSLGVFRRRDTMVERRDRLVALGYAPAVTERVKSRRRYWLVARFLTPVNAPSAAGEGAAVSWSAVTCPGTLGAGELSSAER